MSDVAEKTVPAALGGAPPRRFQFRLIHLLVATGLIGAALALLVPMYRVARREALQMRSQNNLRQIAIALHTYHDVYGRFPPAYECDASGKPAHSWRVLIAPFADQNALYSRYNFSEPWNGPNNSKLGQQTPRMFRSPFDNAGTPNTTSYIAIVGPGTMWPGETSLTLNDVTQGDGASHTIMVVELLNTGIHWMEPRDLRIEDLDAVWRNLKHKPPRMDDWETSYAFVAYADGSIDWLEREATIERLRALLTPDGDETVERHGEGGQK